jgi:hypothetical protein
MFRPIKRRTHDNMYKHYKGGIYEVLFVGEHTETQEEMVIYRKQNEEKIYVRPKSMFFGLLESGERRFAEYIPLVNNKSIDYYMSQNYKKEVIKLPWDEGGGYLVYYPELSYGWRTNDRADIADLERNSLMDFFNYCIVNEIQIPEVSQ